MVSPLEKYYDKFEDYEKIAVRYNVKIEGPALKPEEWKYYLKKKE